MTTTHLSSSFITPFKLTPEEQLGGSTGKQSFASGQTHTQYSPVDGTPWTKVRHVTLSDYEKVIHTAQQAFLYWREVPAPRRGAFVAQVGEVLSEKKESLAQLVSYEMGKPYAESLGEVQEMIDICHFAQGLSRQLYGLTMHSERPMHRIYEQYHPLGLVGIISAFNFPVAVWSWNAAIAWVCGDVCLWKPSEKAPLSALAVQALVANVCAKHHLPEGISSVLIGDHTLGKQFAQDKRIPLISATGSVRMGRHVAEVAGKRLGRTLLELGGNSALIVSSKGRLSLAVRAALFGATGTAGQRCTTTRRVFVDEKVYDTFIEALAKAYAQLKIGNPLEEVHHVGPLVDEAAVDTYKQTLTSIQAQGGRPIVAGEVIRSAPSNCYVKPAVYEMPAQAPLLAEETFVPILYVVRYTNLKEAIEAQNAVSQGLSSAMITDDLQEAEYFLSHRGSDCGIANVNIGTSGAEIGGAFGGEKDTGGGREAGSDAWKAYMRRQTNTINYGENMPLAQGITFDV